METLNLFDFERVDSLPRNHISLFKFVVKSHYSLHRAVQNMFSWDFSYVDAPGRTVLLMFLNNLLYPNSYIDYNCNTQVT